MPARFAALFLALVALAGNGWSQLAGTYTVDPRRPTGGRNFASLPDAMAALTAQGIASGVSFELSDRAGPYRTRMPFQTANVAFGTSDAVLTLAEVLGASPASRITFRPMPGHRPVFDATGMAMGVFWNGADYVTLEGIEIFGATFDAISLYSEALHGKVYDAVIRGCRLHSCGGAGIVLYGNLPAPENTLIENNLLHDLQQVGSGGFVNLARFGYINTRRAFGTRILHNTIVANSGVGPWFAVIGSNPGSLNDQPIHEFDGNIISKTVRPDRPIFFFPTISNIASLPLQSDYNLFDAQNQGPLAAVGNTGTVLLQTLADWRTLTHHDGSSLTDDPCFEQPAQRNFRLRAHSVAVDTGSTDPTRSPVDAVGTLRRATPDRGALEFVPAQAYAWSYGHGSFGYHGAELELHTQSVPALGNLGFALSWRGAPPYADAFLFAAFDVAQNPGRIGRGAAFLLEERSFLALVQTGQSPLGPAPTGADGQGQALLPIVQDPRLQGLRLALQLVIDEGTPTLPFQVSNALVLEIR